MVSPKMPEIHRGLSRLQKARALIKGLRHGAPVVEVAAAHVERFSDRKDLTPHQIEIKDRNLQKILSRASVSDICRLLKRKFNLSEQHRLVEELEKRYWKLFHEVCDPLIEYYVYRVVPKLFLRVIRSDIEEQKHFAEWPGIGIGHETLLVRKMHHLHEFRKTINDLLRDASLDPLIKHKLTVLGSELSEKRYKEIMGNYLEQKHMNTLHSRGGQYWDRGIDH